MQPLLELVKYALKTPILALDIVPVAFRDPMKSWWLHVVCHSFTDWNKFLNRQHLMQLLIPILIIR